MTAGILIVRNSMPAPIDILVTGGTGYIGRRLVPMLVARGHRVRVLTRPQSAGHVPDGATAVVGDALDKASVLAALKTDDSVVHLIGTPHPSPAKGKQFEQIDLASIRAMVAAATQARISDLVYVSVAQPAPVMQAYLWVRALGEAMIREAELTATILRPWYVLGPGRWWPRVFIPLYKLAERFSATRGSAER
ncbi:MAG TPA: NAD(P)H-binding protein, partial [Candidatus Limnocylindria bacterium]|nr:NAD(P)H-binding protein [Candidatus Limnocylindria bacterium]